MVQRTVLLAIIVAHALTGVASVGNRYLVAFLDPSEVTCLRYIFGAAFVAMIFVLERPKAAEQAYWVKSILLGILFFALFPYLFAASFEHIGAARGALIISTMAIWSMIIGQITGRETINKQSLIAVSLTMLGLAVALSDKLQAAEFTLNNLQGELIMLAAAIVGAIYSLIARFAFVDIATSRYTLIGMVSGFIAMSPFAFQHGLIHDVLQFDLQLTIIIILFGCFTGGLAFYLFNWVLKRSSATFATLFVPLNPIVAMVLGWWLLNESLTVNFVIGTAIVIIGLVIASRRQIRVQS